MDCSPSGSSAHGILQVRIVECVAIPFPRGSSQPRDWTQVSCTAGRFFIIWSTREALCIRKVYICIPMCAYIYKRTYILFSDSFLLQNTDYSSFVVQCMDARRMHAKLLQFCPTLWDPTDSSLPGSPVRGILQARILEWVAICSFRGTSRPRDQTCISHVLWLLYH